MTHDELLAKLDEITIKTNNTPLSLGIQTALLMQNKALRAVVEFHKPVMTKFSESTNGAVLQAERCDCGRSYPCPTIQAIEKELK